MSKNDINKDSQTKISNNSIQIKKSEQFQDDIKLEQPKQVFETQQFSEPKQPIQIEQLPKSEQHPQTIQSEQSKLTSISYEKDIQFNYSSNDNTALLQQMHKHFADKYKKNEFCDEIRYFHMPASSVRKEYETLCQYKKDNMFELIQILCTDLLSIITLLEYLNENKNTSIEELYKICASISSPVLNLKEICSQLADSKLIHKRIA